MIRGSPRRLAWAVHVALALVFPFAVWGIGWLAIGKAGPWMSDVAPGLGWLLASLYAVTPLATYGWLLLRRAPDPPADEPCRRSGSLLGWHWFEFASRPDQPTWTGNLATARRIRARPVELPVDAGVSSRLRTRRDWAGNRQVATAVEAYGMAFASVLLGYAWIGVCVVVGLFATGSPSMDTLSQVLDGMGWGLFLLVPFLVVATVLYGGGFTLLWTIWHLLAPRRSRHIVVDAHQLRSDGQSIDLDDPDFRVHLSYRRFGARLELVNPRQRLVLHGDHDVLAPLAATLEARQRSTPEERRHAQQAVQALLDR